MKASAISSPEHLENGKSYDVWYSMPTPKTHSGKASKEFTDVFTKLTGDKSGLFLNFVEQPPLRWLYVTCIKETDTGECEKSN